MSHPRSEGSVLLWFPQVLRGGHIERHLRHEPERTSRSRIKRLRGALGATYRLRVGEYRVFYDVHDVEVAVVAVLHKRETASFYREDES